jgi:hypothetical protein
MRRENGPCVQSNLRAVFDDPTDLLHLLINPQTMQK